MPTSASSCVTRSRRSDFDISFLWCCSGKAYVLLDGQRIVKRGVLKQKTHFLPDLAELVESQAGDVLPVDANRSRVRFSRPMMSRQQYALARTTAPQHRQGLAAPHRSG
jgi:hypothetical protein